MRAHEVLRTLLSTLVLLALGCLPPIEICLHADGSACARSEDDCCETRSTEPDSTGCGGCVDLHLLPSVRAERPAPMAVPRVQAGVLVPLDAQLSTGAITCAVAARDPALEPPGWPVPFRPLRC